MRASGEHLSAFAGRWSSPSRVLADLAIRIACGFALLVFDAGSHRLVGTGAAASIDALLPRGPLETVLWIGVSLTAGAVEEFVFRGYLLAQLTARFGKFWLAAVAQALWFAAMHAYEGLETVVAIIFIAIAFAMLARARRDLGANIVAHACYDLVAGLAPKLIAF